jgi:sRNA-binding protein
LPQFRDAQLQCAEPGVERAVAVTVAPGGPLAVALVTPGADQPLDIGLHQQLQHRLCHGSQKISLTSLLQQLGQYQSLFGHRVLLRFRLKSHNSTLADRPDGHLNSAAEHTPRTVLKLHHLRGR